MIFLRSAIVGLFFVLVSCQPNDTIVLEAWDNKQPKIVHFYPDPSDRSVYEYRAFWQNGDPKVTGNYVEGKKAGEWEWKKADGKTDRKVMYEKGKEMSKTLYFENGSPQELITHTQSGSSQGAYTYYYETGQVVSKGNYAWSGKEDKMHGVHKEYHKNGETWNEGFYNMGKRDSSWNWYDSTGIMTASMLYDMGKRVSSRAYGANDSL